MKLTSLITTPRALWVVGALALGSCQKEPLETDENLAVASEALSAPATAALGFESLASWTISSGKASLSTQRTQGTNALQLQGPVNYTTIASAPLAMTAADLAPLTNAGGYVAIDLLLPTQQPNPQWSGTAQMFVNCPARGVFNQFLGQLELTGHRLGNYQTYRFAATSSVQQPLTGKDCSNFSLTFALSLPASGTGIYRVDNIRFKAAGDPSSTGTGNSVDLIARRAGTPPVSTPGTATFAESRIQVPASFHVAQGKSGSGQVTLLLARNTTDRTTCTYAGQAGGASYAFTSCTRGEQAGDLVIATSATLTIVSSDATAGDTKVNAQLAINPTGDELVAGLTPIPTFWGNSAAEFAPIQVAYFNQVAAHPAAGAHVQLPSPAAGRRTSGVRIEGATFDAKTPPFSLAQPAFDPCGDVGGDDFANGYWCLSGAFTPSLGGPNGDHVTTTLTADANVHGVLLTLDKEILHGVVTFNSDSGVVTPTGHSGGSVSGSVVLSVFGDTVDTESLSQSLGPKTLVSETFAHSFPIPFGIFEVDIGFSASVGVVLEATTSTNGITMTLNPNAQVNATLKGEVNLLVASGGLEATVNVINVGFPFSVTGQIDVDTRPEVCAALVHASVDSDATISVGAGSIDAFVTFGNCDLDLCDTESMNITSWPPIIQHTIPFIHIPESAGGIPLPRSSCDQPLQVSIDCAPDNQTVVAGLATAFNSTAEQPPSPDPTKPGTSSPPVPIPCGNRTWTSDVATDLIGNFYLPADSEINVVDGLPAPVCTTVIIFEGTGPHTVTLHATNGFTTTTATTHVNVIDFPPGTVPPARMAFPAQTCSHQFNTSAPVLLQGSFGLANNNMDGVRVDWLFRATGQANFTLIGSGAVFDWLDTPTFAVDGTLRFAVTNVRTLDQDAVDTQVSFVGPANPV